MTPRHAGRPTTFDESICAAVLELIEAGSSIKDAAKSVPGAPDDSVLRSWFSRPDVFPRYASARAVGCDAMADDVIRIADDIQGDPDANSRRLRVDARRWYLSKIAPKIYGDKIQVDGPAAQTAVQIVIRPIAESQTPAPVIEVAPQLPVPAKLKRSRKPK